MATWEMLPGDALAVLPTLPAASVHTCVTSPPYYGLRDYGTGKWEGGDVACDHKPDKGRRQNMNTLGEQFSGGGHKASTATASPDCFKASCGKCGAVRVDAQIGLEGTPEEYIARLVSVFREVRRVLHDSGTLWVNIGDSYAGGGGGNYSTGTRNYSGQNVTNVRNRSTWLDSAGVKAKDMLGIPWMLAFALRADGWYLRSDSLWCKKSPMPESVTDRPTKAHEYVFLLTKRPDYFYDQEAERIGLAVPPHAPGNHDPGKIQGTPEHQGGNSQFRDSNERAWGNEAGRNLWTTWADISPEPYAEAHFATMPPDLARRCIRLGTSEHGACAKCLAPWQRILERKKLKRERPNEYVKRTGEDGTGNTVAGVAVQTLGWEPTCKCGVEEVKPCTVIDPFAGAGTTILAALRLGRSAIGVELNPDYCDMARRRVTGDCPLFNAAPEAQP